MFFNCVALPSFSLLISIPASWAGASGLKQSRLSMGAEERRSLSCERAEAPGPALRAFLSLWAWRGDRLTTTDEK